MAMKAYAPSLHWQTAIFAAGLAMFFGLAASLGSPLLVAFLVALALAGVLAASPVALLWLVVIGGLVFAGVAELYFPAIRQARWGVVIVSAGLGLVAVLSAGWQRETRRGSKPEPWPSVVVFAVIFFLIALFSGVLNLGMTMDTAVGFKGYFQVWSILLAFALLPLRPPAAERFMASLVWLGLLQFPFILHQHFVLVPQRLGATDAAKGIVAQDVLVGTFTGSMDGGGAGPAMAVLLLVALMISIAYWRCGRMSLLRLGALALVLLLPMAIGEHKIVLVLLPLGLVLVFEDKILQSPLRAMGLLSIAACVVALMFMVFTLLPRGDNSRPLTPGEYLEQMLAYNVGDRGYGNALLNRTTVYPFWANYQQSGSGSVINTLIGYGPGASKDPRGSLAEHSLSSERFPRYGIGLTGISGLLWDVGLLGTIAAAGFFVSAYRMARRLVREAPPKTLRWAHLKGAEAGAAMMGLSLLHNNMFLFEIGFQTLLMVLVGYLIYARRSYAIPNANGGVPPRK